MKKGIITGLCFLFFCMAAIGQTSDNEFKEPLKDVIKKIEDRFQVSIRYPEDLVKDKWVTYAGWRFRPNLEQTMNNIFSSLDISFSKEGDNKYKLQAYRYHLKTPEEGKAQLDYLSSLYNNKSEWEERKAALRECIQQTLHLSKLKTVPAGKPIFSNKRVMNGYSVENFTIESLPGVYVAGSIYRPLKIKGKVPVILNPNGHFADGRYNKDVQIRCAMLARMGAIAVNYDLFAWGESELQFESTNHRKSLAMVVQALNSTRILDYLLSLKEADPERAAITGGSGGGSQTMLITALDDRIKVSAPVVMTSSYHSGGCPCESGMPVHLCGGGTNNPEIAAMAAPRPQLIVSDGKDWTAHVPEDVFPYLKRVYSFYGKEDLVTNVHLPEEGHDYGFSKRRAMYDFFGKYLKLNTSAVKDKSGNYDESACTVEPKEAMLSFGRNGEKLPADALRSFQDLEKLFNEITKK